MNIKTPTKIAFSIITLILLTSIIVFAGNLFPSATPAPTSYTLNDIYNLISNSNTITLENHPISTTTAPIVTTHSISEIYALLANLIQRENIRTGITYLGVTGLVNTPQDPARPTVSTISSTLTPDSHVATGYSLEDIWNLITNNATTTAASHTLSTTTTPAASMHTITQIYTALVNLINPANVKAGVTYLRQAGTLDAIAPASSTLALGDPTTTSILVSWTAPGDDNTTGTATRYDLRYSTSAITAENFASATPAAGTSTPQVAGTSESAIVTGLTAETTYYFALKTYDEEGNVSAISITADPGSLATDAEVVLTACGSGDTSNLVAYYRGEDNPNDTSSNGYNGTWNGTVAYATDGKAGKGFAFNGTDSYLTLPIQTEVSQYAWSWEMWIRPKIAIQSGTWYAINTWLGGQQNNFNIGIPGPGGGLNTGRIMVAWFPAQMNGWIARQTVGEASTLLPQDTWTHLVITRSETGLLANTKFYINGSEVSSESTGDGTRTGLPTLNTFSSAPMLGGAEGGAKFNADFDEVAIYSKELSSAEVSAHYARGVASAATCPYAP